MRDLDITWCEHVNWMKFYCVFMELNGISSRFLLYLC